MISVDTNVLVRLLTRDDETQYQQSFVLFQSAEIFITDTVILETEWVLRFAYGFEPMQIAGSLQNLCELPNVHVRDATILAQVWTYCAGGLDFADALHLALSQGHDEFITFDQRLIKRSQLLQTQPLVRHTSNVTGMSD